MYRERSLDQRGTWPRRHAPDQNYPPLVDATLDRALRFMRPLERLLDVQFEGMERLPREPGPVLFIGNHQLFALDSPFLVAEMWRNVGVPLRPFVDDVLFLFPPVARVLRAVGAVRASPEAARALIAQDAWMLVYPGGAREAMKPDGRRYELLWWDRLGFAEIAIEHRCTIVPVAATGIDDSVQILVGSDRILQSPLGKFLRWLRVRPDTIPPLGFLRRRPRLRFRLCEPIRIDHFDGHPRETASRMLRVEVARAIESALEAMGELPVSTADKELAHPAHSVGRAVAL